MDRYDRIAAELQELIAAEEIEIELLGYATGTAAVVATALRSQFVNQLKRILEAGAGD